MSPDVLFRSRAIALLEGQPGFNIITQHAHMETLTAPNALLIFNAIPQAVKDGPANANLARAISMVAQNAGRTTPHGCVALLPAGQAKAETLRYYNTPGSPIFTKKNAGAKFISFLYQNMDVGHSIPWYDMTGREQYEWYSVWEHHNHTYQRIPQTLGLRGTNLARIADPATLRIALTHSPSLSRRRPANHNIQPNAWQDLSNARRVLNMMGG